MIGDITPKFSVVVKSLRDLVIIEFAREIDPDVLADLAKLKNHPAIDVSTGQSTSLLFIKDSYDPKEIAEAISQSLEKNHGFLVRRMASDSHGYKDIRCFTVGESETD